MFIFSEKSINHPFPIVGILLCTFNGGKYLRDQLHSIAFQDYSNWILFVSDDGSTDQTLDIVIEFKKVHGNDKVFILKGPGQGVTSNFLSLVRLTHQQCKYFAFCDQDDIWFKNKLSRALDSLVRFPISFPSLYCSSTFYISDSGFKLRTSNVFKRDPNFKNALVQSIAGGNTMVFNQGAAILLARTPLSYFLVAHDWWAYILISGFSGNIYYDPNPTVYYRQHSGSLVGENRSIQSKLIRIRKLLDGRYKEWNKLNLQVLSFFTNELTPENQIVLSRFVKIRSRLVFMRIYAYIRSGIKRQTFFGNIALFIGILLNKV